jgi:hypothetical protein
METDSDAPVRYASEVDIRAWVMCGQEPHDSLSSSTCQHEKVECEGGSQTI